MESSLCRDDKSLISSALVLMGYQILPPQELLNRIIQKMTQFLLLLEPVHSGLFLSFLRLEDEENSFRQSYLSYSIENIHCQFHQGWLYHSLKYGCLFFFCAPIQFKVPFLQ